MIYSQNNEQLVIEAYFKGKPGHLLDIGANDGQTFSNSRNLLLNLNWSGLLVEPAPKPYAKLKALYKGNDLVQTLNVAIGDAEEWVDFYDMGEHVGNGDSSLLSTMVQSECDRWNGTKFKKTKVRCQPYSEIEDVYDFITIDAEGKDIDILRQIDLKHTYCLCIEWNNNNEVLEEIRAIVPARFSIIHKNLENVIFAV